MKRLDPADAKARIKNMAWAVYDGELIMKTPAQTGLLAKAIVFVMNFFRDRP